MYDVVIIGGGIVGSSAALLLAQDASLNIAIIEANIFSSEWNPSSSDHRVSAISASSKRILQQIKVWEKITRKRVSPYTHMRVFENAIKDALHFNCQDVNETTLGWIIEDNVMRSSLHEKILSCSNINLLFPQQLIAWLETENHLELTLSNQDTIKTKLLIGADGANSKVRELANIALHTKDYEHTAIVATVQTEMPHQLTAWQRFLTHGPLAFLPLVDQQSCSIVWSVGHDYAQELLALNDVDFSQQLSAAFLNQLGEVKQVSKRYHFPLRMRHVKQYVKNRIALIGDAAHTIHPLAGQGVNLGMLDAEVLAKTIHAAREKNRDYASFATLRRYERERKGNNLLMLKTVDILKKMFSHEKTQFFRKIGMQQVNSWDFLRNFLTHYAMGKSQLF